MHYKSGLMVMHLPSALNRSLQLRALLNQRDLLRKNTLLNQRKLLRS